MSKYIYLIPIIILLSSCAVRYTADPVTEKFSADKNICLITNKDSKEEYINAYKKVLEKRGFTVNIKPPSTPIDTCVLTTTYAALWSWDFVTYLAGTKIYMYKNSQLIGEAEYSAPSGGLALTMKIYKKTETKLDTLLDELFPTKE